MGYQNTANVTVNIRQVWKNGIESHNHPIDAIYYHFHEPGKYFWGSAKCYEEEMVPFSPAKSLDTIVVACNVVEPFAEVEICLVDDPAHGNLVAKKKNAENPHI